MEVFLLSGKSGSGKDTLANIMANKLEEHGCRTLILHFADLVKYYASQYYGWDGEKNEEGRSLLQKIGTTIMRGYNQDYWTKIIGEFLAAMDIVGAFAWLTDTQPSPWFTSQSH